MKTIKLIRPVASPDGTGPGNGMAALQRALRAANFPWLKIGWGVGGGEIPWFWSWQDAHAAASVAEWNYPLLCGPNIFFADSRKPGHGPYERKLLDAESCRLILTESPWYEALIQRHLNRNQAPIRLFSYPIDPIPAGPLPAEYDLMIYLKDMTLGREVIRLQKAFPRSVVVVYGHYKREEMIEVARRSRAVFYASTDDRGPLALMEILCTGAPAFGIERGAPWVCEPGLGVEIPHFGISVLTEAIEKAMLMDREAVRAIAVERFSAARSVEAIRAAMEPITNES